MIKLRCQCGRTLSAKPEFAGKKLKCPACGTIVTVPAASEEVPQSPVKRRQKPQASKPKSSKPTKKTKHTAPIPPSDPVDDFSDLGDFESDYGDLSDPGTDYGSHDSELPGLPKRRKKKASAEAGARKKQEAASDTQNTSKGLMYGLYGMAAVVSGLIMFTIVRTVMNASFSADVDRKTPDTFSKFEHKAASLSSEYPEAWDKRSGGGTGGIAPWIRFENSDLEISISIRGSISGTAISDIAAAGGGMLQGQLGDEIPDELDPVAAVHQYQRDKISGEYNEYEETEPVPIETGFGEGRICEFTAGSTFSTEYGVRATLIANQYQYNVICKCPKKLLEEYKPVFERIIKSIGQ